jgi:predicted GNAT family acetyltransferase
MVVNLEENENKGRAYHAAEDSVLAEMTFSKAGKTLIIIDHTEVDESLRGQGVGKKLLDKIAQMVRERNIKVSPLCPYAKSHNEKEASLHDIRQKSK